MNELKKHLDEKVFAQNPFNDQIKQKMINGVLKSSGVKHKRKGPIIAMISAACIILLFVVTALEAPALFGIGTSASGLEELQKQHPEIQQEVKKIPERFINKVKVPTKFPFDVKLVKLDVVPDNNKLGAPSTEAHFLYSTGTKTKWQSLMFDLTFTGDAKVGFGQGKKIILDNGQTAYWTKNKNASLLQWYDKKAGIVYSIGLMSSPDLKHNFTKEDLLLVANSMR